MNTNALLIKAALPLTASFSLLTACGPAPVQSGASPSPAVSPVTPLPTQAPSTFPTSPAESPSATVTPIPPSASTSPSSPVIPTASSTVNPPLASVTSDISVVERTTFNGKVFDDTTAPIDGVTVTAKSLNSSVPFDATSTTAGGAYAFNNAPAGVQIEITVSKPGFTTRRRVEVLKSNKDGNPDANKYDFGAGAGSTSNGTAANALSDKPEVTVVTPNRNSAGVSPTTSFVLKFSEPMDRATVVDNFEVRTFINEKLSVDTSAAANTVTGTGDVNVVLGNTRIWDKAAFNVSWNSDDTEATFTFKEERSLPSDKDTDKVPDYQVSLERQDANIKDKSGITRSTSSAVTGGGTGAFKLTEGNFERSFKFSIAADTVKPRIDSITAQTAENSGVNSDGDAIKVRYNERMIHYTLGPTIAGGMGGVASQGAAANNALAAEAAAANYKVTVIRAGVTLLNQVTWASLGGRAIFDTNDATHKTVSLLPGTSANALTVGGALLNNDAFVVNATLNNAGTTSTFTLPTSTFTAQSNNTIGHVSAGADISSVWLNVEYMTIMYTDGTVETNVDLITPDNTYASLDSRLEALTNSTTDDFTITDNQTSGLIEANDIVNIQLNAGATRPFNGVTRPIAWIVLNNGVFQNTTLSTPGLNMSGYIATSTDAAVLQAVLNRGLDTNSPGKFTVTETNLAGGAGTFAAGDQVSITLGAGATANGGQTITSVNLTQAGGFTANRLNAPVGGAFIYPGAGVGSSPDIYRPGDNVSVTVDTTVLDPAGNSLDSAGDDASANAS